MTATATAAPEDDDATDRTVAALLNEAGILCESAQTYRRAGLDAMANAKRVEALAVIHRAQVMMMEGA